MVYCHTRGFFVSRMKARACRNNGTARYKEGYYTEKKDGVPGEFHHVTDIYNAVWYYSCICLALPYGEGTMT